MFFQPAILAILLASGLGLAALLLAAPSTVQLVRHWDIRSASRLQLVLERRTYLVSALVVWVLWVQMAALLLFVFNADRMAEQFVGAMCAVGTLQADAYGFPALYAQMTVFFLATAWLALHYADTHSPRYPATRLKFALLLAVLLPAMALVFGLQWAYFGNLHADIITSCCGSLFSEDSAGITGEMAGWPPRQAMFAFVLALLAAVMANGWHAWRGSGAMWAGVSSLVAFVVALAGIVSFVSLYIYEDPHHHCPFCMLQAEYGYRGYLLYIPLFAAGASGLGAGTLGLAQRLPGLEAIASRIGRQLAWIAVAGFLLFLAVSLGMVWHSRLVLLE